jgi:hypothetical protein
MSAPSFLLETTEVQSKLGIRPRAIDLEGHFRARTVLLKDAIERHQQYTPPASDHARHSGFHIRRSGEIEFSTIKAIDACELDARSWYVVMQIGQIKAD